MSDNPAWKPLLDKLPPALHDMIKPILTQWDEGVQAKFQEIHAEYEPLKAFQPFVDNNIAADFAMQSVAFADELQRDPAGVAKQINDNWQLGFMTKEEAEALVPPANNADDGDLFENEDGKIDLTKIPEFVTMKQTLDAIQKQKDEEERNNSEQQALADFERELADLEKKTVDPNGDGTGGKPFHKVFVTALMAQGLSGDDAVKQYHEVLAGVATPPENNDQPSNTDAPITMGNSGTVGGGQSNGEVKWADMSTSDFNANVAKVLEAQMSGNDT